MEAQFLRCTCELEHWDATRSWQNITVQSLQTVSGLSPSSSISLHLWSRKPRSNPFRIWFGVRSLKPVWNLPLAQFGEPTDPSQARKRFGFSRPWEFDLKEILRILHFTDSEGPQLYCLIIRLSQVRVLVGPPFNSIAYDQFPSLLNILWDTHSHHIAMTLMSWSTGGTVGAIAVLLCGSRQQDWSRAG